MNEQNQRDSIMSMARGAFEERVDYEMDKVIQNILDPNTKATAKRKITLTIELTPDDERRTIGVSVTAKSTLAATNPVATALYVTVQFIIMCERADKLRRTYFFTQKRRRGYEIRVLKARGAADYRGNVRKGRKAGRDCRACRQVPSDHIPRARARQDRGNRLPLSSRV